MLVTLITTVAVVAAPLCVQVTSALPVGSFPPKFSSTHYSHFLDILDPALRLKQAELVEPLLSPKEKVESNNDVEAETSARLTPTVQKGLRSWLGKAKEAYISPSEHLNSIHLVAPTGHSQLSKEQVETRLHFAKVLPHKVGQLSAAQKISKYNGFAQERTQRDDQEKMEREDYDKHTDRLTSLHPESSKLHEDDVQKRFDYYTFVHKHASSGGMSGKTFHQTNKPKEEKGVRGWMRNLTEPSLAPHAAKTSNEARHRIDHSASSLIRIGKTFKYEEVPKQAGEH